MKSWRFMDYYSEAGTNLIEKWYGRLPEDAQAEFDILLDYLSITHSWTDLKQVKALTGKHSGLIELRFSSANVQYRPVGFFGPEKGEFTLVLGCQKKQAVYDPPDAFDTAADRKRLYFNIGRGSIHEHSF